MPPSSRRSSCQQTSPSPCTASFNEPRRLHPPSASISAKTTEAQSCAAEPSTSRATTPPPPPFPHSHHFAPRQPPLRGGGTHPPKTPLNYPIVGSNRIRWGPIGPNWAPSVARPPWAPLGRPQGPPAAATPSRAGEGATTTLAPQLSSPLVVVLLRVHLLGRLRVLLRVRVAALAPAWRLTRAFAIQTLRASAGRRVQAAASIVTVVTLAGAFSCSEQQQQQQQ